MSFNGLECLARKRSSRLALATMIAMVGCGKGTSSDETTGTPVVTVETAPVTSASFSPTVSAVGSVVSSPKGYAELSAPAASRVSRVLVTAGQSVRAGEALVQLDAATLQAAANGANAASDAAQQAYQRASRLSQDGIIPRKTVDQARADLAQANAAAVAARRTYALSTLRSPIAGVVTKMSAVTGASVDPSQVLVAIADPRGLQVLLQLSPADAASVRPGAAVALFESDAPTATAIGHGVVATVGEAVDSATRAVPIRVRVTQSARALRLGETITGKVAFAGAASAMSIPSSALVPDSTGFRVYVVRNGVAYATPVEVGTRGDSLVQVTKGLAVGQTVVTTGAYGLEDSSKVTAPKR